MQKSFFLMKLLSSMPFLKGESYYLKVRLDEALEDVWMDLLEDLWTFLIAKKNNWKRSWSWGHGMGFNLFLASTEPRELIVTLM